jgi:S1-C subfamily serine protease/pSer/pThr/pTyr-binding forkhead associated (FHA) protein
VKPQIRVITGGPAGSMRVFSQPRITIGRHPESDIAFDSHGDLEVSARHALILKRDDSWIIRDLESRNGTLVNGHRMTGDTKLNDTDQIRLGPGGPLIEFRLVPDHIPDTGKSPAVTGAGGVARPPRSTLPPVGRGSTTQRVRAEVARQTRRLRGIAAGLFIVLVAVAAGLLIVNRRMRQSQEREVAALQAEIDSVLQDARATVATLEEEMSELASTLEESRQEIQSLQGRLTEARAAGNADRIQTLSAELQGALTALAQQQHAASIDFAGIATANQPAVGMMFVEFPDGRVETSTAFAVRPDGIMLTTRHSVAGPSGDRPARQIGVRFADSRQTFPGTLLAVAQGQDADLAVIRVHLGSSVPTIQAINPRSDSVPVGAPVAVIGFPGGLDSPQRVRPEGTYATPSLTAGTVSKNLPSVIQINGYGSHGASGSPVFDANGEVIGILSAGEVGSGGRIVYAVPSALATQLLAEIQ